MLGLLSIIAIFSLVVAQQEGTNYRTDDGLFRSENIDQEGNIRGQYSYFDPNGKTIIVKYTAGKNGFQVEDEHPSRDSVKGSPTLPSYSQPNPYAQIPPQFSQVPAQNPYKHFNSPSSFLPILTRQYTPISEDSDNSSPPSGAQQAQFSPDSLFIPSGRSYGNAASQGQIAQFNEGQTQTQAPPVQFSQQPTPRQFAPLSSSIQYTQPQNPQIPSQFKFSPQIFSNPSPLALAQPASHHPRQLPSQFRFPSQLKPPSESISQPTYQDSVQLGHRFVQGSIPASPNSYINQFPSPVSSQQYKGLIQGSNGAYTLSIASEQ